MSFRIRRFVFCLVVVAIGFSFSVRAQDDEAVAEDLLMDEALVEDEDLEDFAEDELLDEELLDDLDEELLDDVDEEPADVAAEDPLEEDELAEADAEPGVEELAAEALGEEAGGLEDIVEEEKGVEIPEEVAVDELDEDVLEDVLPGDELDDDVLEDVIEDEELADVGEADLEELEEDIEDELAVDEDVAEDVLAEDDVEALEEEPAEDDFVEVEAADNGFADDAVEEAVKEAARDGVDLGQFAVDSDAEIDDEAVDELAEENGFEDLDNLAEEAIIEAVSEGVSELPPMARRKPAARRRPSPPRPVGGAVDAGLAAEIAEPADQEPEPPLDPKAAKLAEVVGEEALRRRAMDVHGRESMRGAEEALVNRQYEKATKLFEEALAYLKRGTGETVDRQRARNGLGKTFYLRAQFRKSEGNLDDAITMAQSSARLGYMWAPKLILEIEKARTVEPPPDYERVTDRRQDRKYLKARNEIKRFLLEAGQHLVTREYKAARMKLESVMKRDPYNVEAIRLMRKVAREEMDAATVELEVTRKDMMAQVRKAWNPRTYAVDEEARVFDSTTDGNKTTSVSQMIIKKMKEIKIPEIDFREANIHDVIDFLQEQSIVEDKSEGRQDERRGVNIILNLGKSGGRGGAEELVEDDDPFAMGGDDFGEGGGGGRGAGDVPLITFSARFISLFEALKIVTEVAGLKYRVDKSVVMIIPLDWPDGDIIRRMYSVQPSIGDRIAEMDTGGGGGGRGAGDFMAMDGSGISSVREDWKKFFGDMGVPWPATSSIRYVPQVGKIVVANTAQNLTIFEEVLAMLNVIPNQIEIEARFVEITQTDLNSLGFEWLLNSNWEMMQQSGQGNVPLSGRQRIRMNANANAFGRGGGFTKGMRTVMDGGLGVAYTSIADDLVTVASVLTNPELTFVLHLLEQNGNADLLSAPRVTTQSGSEATIKVVTEYIYPTDFTVTPIQGAAAGGAGAGTTITGGVVEPSGFETREVGVILTVLPEVSPEGTMINLTMAPEVVSPPEWHNYGSTYVDADGRTQQLNMEQPFFHTRTVSTTISIYNGATVVMGGMITEVRTEVDDKIPFLGDLPIIGRFFRSKYEHSEKSNLLIFVTARLVDPAGRPLDRREQIGVQSFVDSQTGADAVTE